MPVVLALVITSSIYRDPNGLSSQALGTAINSTKVMTAQQVVKTDDGGEVRCDTCSDRCCLPEIATRPSHLIEQYAHCMLCVSLYGECSRPCLWLRLIHSDMIS